MFNGGPIEADRSQVLDKLREDLENKKYLIDGRFGRPVTLVVEGQDGKRQTLDIQAVARAGAAAAMKHDDGHAHKHKH